MARCESFANARDDLVHLLDPWTATPKLKPFCYAGRNTVDKLGDGHAEAYSCELNRLHFSKLWDKLWSVNRSIPEQNLKGRVLQVLREGIRHQVKVAKQDESCHCRHRSDQPEVPKCLQNCNICNIPLRRAGQPQADIK